MKAKLYCLRDFHGTLYPETIATTKTEVWGKDCYSIVAQHEGVMWARKYWKKWDSSIAAAKKLGWTIVPVKLTEVSRKGSR